jgi:hypothetical protein
MKDIREVYDASESGYFYAYDYSPLLESFGYEIVVQIDEHNYQGDSWLLFRDDNRYGYLCFGWGSCSGCDALQACGSYQEIEALQHELYNAILWFDSLDETLQWFYTHDWEGDYSWSRGEQQQFRTEAINYLKEHVNG